MCAPPLPFSRGGKQEKGAVAGSKLAKPKKMQIRQKLQKLSKCKNKTASNRETRQRKKIHLRTHSEFLPIKILLTLSPKMEKRGN